MNSHPPKETSVERAILTTLARKAVGGIVTVEEAALLLGLSLKGTAIRLAALTRHGWLTRIRRGKYYILPLESSGGVTAVAPDPWVLAHRLFTPCYVGGWSAAEHWGLTEQLFRSTFVVTSANIRDRSPFFLGTEFHLVRVRPDRFSGAVPVWRESVRVQVSDREQTIADALVDPTWVGGIRHLIDMMKVYTGERKSDFQKVFEYLSLSRTAAGFKRFGFLLEKLFPDETTLISAARERLGAGLIRLDPSIRTKGRLLKRWGLWVNATIPSLEEE